VRRLVSERSDEPLLGRPGRKEHIMLTLILIFVLMPVFVFLGLTVQRWLFRSSAEKNDPEWELYQQRYD
jgi:hypothetical protein